MTMRLTYSTPHALLGTREVEEDDDIALDLPELVGGRFITGLSSKRPGDAARLLAQMTADLDAQTLPCALVAFAESGDHDRLRRLYARFGFESVSEACPSLMLRHPQPL